MPMPRPAPSAALQEMHAADIANGIDPLELPRVAPPPAPPPGPALVIPPADWSPQYTGDQDGAA